MSDTCIDDTKLLLPDVIVFHFYHQLWSRNSKYVSDLRQLGALFRVLRFLPPIKLTATI